MKKKFTFLMAALGLLAFLAVPLGMRGQTVSTTMTDYVTAHGCTISSGNTVTCYTVLTLDANITMSTSGSANCGSFWGTTNTEWRLYQNKGGDVTITAASGYSLSSVKLTFSATNGGILVSGSTSLESATAYSVSGSSVTYTVGNSSSATNGQIRITAVEVVYTSTGGSSSDPEIQIAAEELQLGWQANDEGAFNVTYTNDFEPFTAFAKLYNDIEGEEEFDGDWIVLVDEDLPDPSVIEYIVEDNTGSDVRPVYLYVEAMDADENIIDAMFAITQAAQPTYEVTYYANGGSGTMTDDDSPYHEGDAVVLLDNTFTAPDGMIWDSWQVKDASDNDVEVDEGMFEMPASNVTVTAQWVTDPSGPEYEWVLTDLADLTEDDIFVIVGTRTDATYGGNYAMTNNGGTSNAPAAFAVTIANDRLSSAPADNLKWNISGNADDGYIFYPNGTTATWLYCTNTNNGVRVGTNNDKVFTINDGYLYHGGTSRHVGVYQAQDWRCYSPQSGNVHSNIADQTFSFFKRQVVTNDPYITADNVGIEYNAEEGEIEFEIHYPVTGGAISAQVVGTPEISNFELGEETESPISFTCDANDSKTARTAVVRLTYTYNSETKTKDVTITQAGNPNVVDDIEDITTIGDYYSVKGTIVAKSNRGLVFGDGTGYVYYYNASLNNDTTYHIGDIKKISGTISHYQNSVFQFTSAASIDAATGSNYNNTPAIQVLDSTDVTAYSSNGPHLSDYVQIQGTLSKTTGNNTYYNIAIPGVENTASISYPTTAQATALDALVGGTVVVKGYFAGVSSGHFNVVMESAEAVAVPTYELEIEAENGTVAVSIGNQVQTGTDGSYQIPAGSTVTLTVAADEGYRFVEWDVEAEVGTVTIENNQFVMPACYVLVQATFEEIPEYGYWYTINGVSGDVTEQPEGTEITLASGANLPNDQFTFAGWTTDPNDVSNILLAGAKVILEDDMEFTAVYAHTTTIGNSTSKTGEASYVKVTTTADLTDGNYLIVYEDGAVAFDGSRDNVNDMLDASGNTISIEDDLDVAEGVIASNDNTDAAVFAINVTNGTIQSASGFYVGRTTDANGMLVSDETAYANTITIAEDENAVILSEGGAYMRYNSDSGQERFRFFKSATYTGQKAIQLYKYTVSGTTPTPVSTTAYYTRVFLENPTANVTITGPSIIPSGTTLDMGAYTLTNNLTESYTKLVIEDGAQLKISNQVKGTLQKNIAGYGESTREGYYLVASPFKGQVSNINNFRPETANMGEVDWYEFNESQDLEWVNKKYGSGDPVVYQFDGQMGVQRGKGYLYARKNGVVLGFAASYLYEFVGGEPTPIDEYLLPTNDTYTIPADDLSYTEGADFAGWNLVGNPFTCDAYVNRTFFRMNPAGSAIVEGSGTVKPGEGVFVVVTDTDKVVKFSTSNPPVFNAKLAINLNEDNTLMDRAVVNFKGNQDITKFVFNESTPKLYISRNGKDYAVVNAGAHGEMPVNFKTAEEGTYTISVEAENLEMNYLHLIDNKTGMDVDLLATPSYTFEGKRTDYASRFRLVFDANSSNIEMGDNFAFMSDGNIVITSEGEATLQVIDMLGRVVSTQTVNGNATINANGAKGVYVLQLVTENNIKTQKIVVR